MEIERKENAHLQCMRSFFFLPQTTSKLDTKSDKCKNYCRNRLNFNGKSHELRCNKSCTVENRERRHTLGNGIERKWGKIHSECVCVYQCTKHYTDKQETLRRQKHILHFVMRCKCELWTTKCRQRRWRRSSKYNGRNSKKYKTGRKTLNKKFLATFFSFSLLLASFYHFFLSSLLIFVCAPLWMVLHVFHDISFLCNFCCIFSYSFSKYLFLSLCLSYYLSFLTFCLLRMPCCSFCVCCQCSVSCEAASYLCVFIIISLTVPLPPVLSFLISFYCDRYATLRMLNILRSSSSSPSPHIIRFYCDKLLSLPVYVFFVFRLFARSLFSGEF